MKRSYKADELQRLIEKDGWVWFKTTGGHRHFKHPVKKGKVTIPFHSKEIGLRLAKSILKQAGL